MQLKPNTLLQGGKYRIEKVLGQGGFGITYLGTQVALNRRVAIKEFFMKEYCNRDSETSQVSVPSEGSKELVSKFRQKFIKEAQNIACLNHPHIIRIHDVFEENGTAYYVMEYWDNGSLADLVKSRGKLSETEALKYIRQVADALEYIHERNMNHLDVKPGNILLDEKQNAVLIDFGLSKRYDEEGNQTSTTPVGISHGYAPLEQYKKGGVGTFSPATDIYSLGATLYKLLTGKTPPEANDVMDDGLPALPPSVSVATATAIGKAMQPVRRDRPQSVKALLEMLEAESVKEEKVNEPEVTELVADEPEPEPIPTSTLNPYSQHKVEPKVIPITEPEESSLKKWAGAVVVGILVVLAVILWAKGGEEKREPVAMQAESRQQSQRQQQVTISSPTGIINGHGYVDLGLSVMWADCNVGASSPGDYGSYFAWGETASKSDYSVSNYKWYKGELRRLTKYCTDVDYGVVDNRKVLTSSDDVATVKWGNKWRMPTQEELQELCDRTKCRWTWITRDGHKGYKIEGPNGKSIFLPAVGWCGGDKINYRGSYGGYWSATVGGHNTTWAYDLSFNINVGLPEVNCLHRYCGLAVRPVTD